MPTSNYSFEKPHDIPLKRISNRVKVNNLDPIFLMFILFKCATKESYESKISISFFQLAEFAFYLKISNGKQTIIQLIKVTLP